MKLRILTALIMVGALLVSTAPCAAAAERMWFPAYENVANELVSLINAEPKRLDISVWYLTEHSVTEAIANRFTDPMNPLPVRLVGDRGSIFEIDPNTRAEFYYLANLGVPIRLRFNPTWFPEIDHWKLAIFAGQNIVEFGSANWDTYSIIPYSSTNYNDETVFFTDDPALVGAFKTKFDVLWNDTTFEPESIYTNGPPYLMDWNDACTNEPTGCDFFQQYQNATQMVIDRTRLEPDNWMPPDLIWGQGPDFNSRLVTEINNENTLIQFANYRLTVDDVTAALLAKQQAGVPVQLIIEPNEYLNRRWPEFWLTHANYDKLWAARVQIKQRQHDGNMHMKSLVTSTYATNASSNIAAAWQRDHDYFVSAATKRDIYNAVKGRVTTMWNDTVGFAPFYPGPPDAPGLSAPPGGASGVPTNASLVWNRAAFATSYDVLMACPFNCLTSGSQLTFVANVQAQMTNNPPDTYSWTPPQPLCAGTTYYWQIVSRTNATPVDPTIVAPSTIVSFTTDGTYTGCSGLPGGGPPPPNVPVPWSTVDVGDVGLTGSATFSNGTFTVYGAGSNIWDTADSFRYVYQSLSGDGQIVAHVASEQYTSPFAKAGLMIRQTTDPGSAHVVVDVRPDGNVEFMSRSTSGATTDYIAGVSQSPPAWLMLAMSGGTVIGSVSSDGVNWTPVASVPSPISGGATIGMVVTAQDPTVINTSTFDSVCATIGAAPSMRPSPVITTSTASMP
jgi:hypothetical protein